MTAEEQLDAIVRLRVEALQQHRLYVGGTQAQTKMREHVEKALASAQRSGCSIVYAPKGKLRAHFTRWHEGSAWYGSPTDFCMVDHQLGNEDAAAWLAEMLGKQSANFSPIFDLTLDSSYPELFHRLVELGLGVDSVILVGDTRSSLSRLANSEKNAAGQDVDIRKLTWKDIDAVVELERVVNTATPQFCWFGRTESFLQQERDRLSRYFSEESLDVRNVIVNGDNEVVGYFGASVDNNPHWGRCGGMVFVLAPELQGKGLARQLYLTVLRQMLDRGVSRFKGGTSQPGIMKLSRVMGREVAAWVFRRGTPFSVSHFGDFVPPRSVQHVEES